MDGIWSHLGDVSSDRWLVGFGVLLLMLGWLVPKASLNAARRESDHWRAAFFRLLGQVDQFAEQESTSQAMVRSLKKKADERSGEAEPGTERQESG